jgi:hypothetical protein
VRECVIEVTMGNASKLPLGFHFLRGTFTLISESLRGNMTYNQNACQIET